MYIGKITDSLSAFVKIGGKPVAVVTSKSLAESWRDRAAGGRTLRGRGQQLSAACACANPHQPFDYRRDRHGRTERLGGSGVLTIGGVKVLLDGDKIDTCDGLGTPANSTVTAAGQSFVNCSG